jgi:hypothetical protein
MQQQQEQQQHHQCSMQAWHVLLVTTCLCCRIAANFSALIVC